MASSGHLPSHIINSVHPSTESSSSTPRTEIAETSRMRIQCDLCKLSYTSQKELREHLVSLMHHTKLEDREKEPQHKCDLCNITCPSMAEYREHILNDNHQRQLVYLRSSENKKRKQKRRNLEHNQEDKFAPRNRHQNQCPKTFNSDGQWRPQSCSQDRDDPTPIQRWGDRSRSYGDPKVQQQHNKRDSYQGQTSRGCSDRYNVYSSYPQQVPTGQQSRSKNGGFDNVKWGLPCTSFQQGWDSQNLPWGSGYDNPNTHTGNNNYSYSKDNTDFTNDNYDLDWDDQSLTMQEQFLACMADDKPYHQEPVQPEYRRSRNVQNSNSLIASHEVLAMKEYRKRPRNEEISQGSIAKASRPYSTPTNEQVKSTSAMVNPVMKSRPVLNTCQQRAVECRNITINPSNIDRTSDSILERAERLCRELREQRESSKCQKSFNQKNTNNDFLNQKMSALIRKQQSYLKGHISEDKKQEESTDSGLNSFSTHKSSDNSANVTATRIKSKKNSLDEIKKSIEKNLIHPDLKTSDKSAVTSPAQKSCTQQPLVSAEKDSTLKSSNTRLDSTSSRRSSSRSISNILSKDTLKNMVNSPRSRLERVKLAKMFQTKEDHKTTPRTNLQLEGLYDLDSSKVSLDLGSNLGLDSTTIKLEDLSDDVRTQILSLIGEDMSTFCVNPTDQTASVVELSSVKSDRNIIVLSDEGETRIRVTSVNCDTKGKMKGMGEKNAMKNRINPGSVSKVSFSNNSAKTKSVKDAHSINQRNMECFSELGRMTTGETSSSSKKYSNTIVVPDTTLTADKTTKDYLEKGRKMEDSRKSKSKKKKSSGSFSKGQLQSTNTKSKSVNEAHSINQQDLRSFSEKGMKTTETSSSAPQKFPNIVLDTTLTKKKTAKDYLEKGQRQKYSHVSEDILDLSSPDVEVIESTAISKTTENKINRVNGFQIPLEDPAQLVLKSKTIREKFPTIMDIPRLDMQESKRLKRSVSPTSENHLLSQTPSSTAESTVGSSCSTIYPSPTLGLNVRPASPSVRKNRQLSKSPLTTSEPPKPSPSRHQLSTVTAQNLFEQRRLSERSSGSESEMVMERCVSSLGTSQAMSDLLVLSEREEEVKKEMMSMDLRLSRLHQLLEQAVVQINKCTEKRNQLHKEGQTLALERLSFLRDAAASNITESSSLTMHPKPTKDASSFPKSVSVIDTFNRPAPLANSRQDNTVVEPTDPPTRSSNSSATVPGTSLSRDDWLAKFSSYLPQDMVPGTSGSKSTPIISNNKPTSTEPFSPVLRSALSSQLIPERDTPPEISVEQRDQMLDKARLNFEKSYLHMPTEVDRNSSSKEKTLQSTGLVSPTASLKVNQQVPIMYVGSFKSPTAIKLSSVPSLLQRPLSDPAVIYNSYASTQNKDHRIDQGNISASYTMSAGPLTTTEACLSATKALAIPRGGTEEDSDIGSVASSFASGSSLGEQITRYCHQTPGASADHDGPGRVHELSVIMSAPSDTNISDVRGRDSQSDVHKANTCKLYGQLTKEDVRSAEALHILERNNENNNINQVVTSHSSGSLDGKRKKMRTRQERDNSGLTHRRRHWILSSSDSDEAKESKQEEHDITAVTARVWSVSSPSNSCHSDRELRDVEKRYTRERRSASPDCSLVTVAECDSSTGVLDLKSINKHSSNLLKMRNSFVKTFGSSPQLSTLSGGNSINFTTSDPIVIDDDDASGNLFDTKKQNVNRDGNKDRELEHVIGVRDKSTNYATEWTNSSCLNQSFDSESVNTELGSLSSSLNAKRRNLVVHKGQDSRYPGSFGSVVSLCLLNKYLYAAHKNYGVRVYDFHSPAQNDTQMEYKYADMQSMAVVMLNGRPTIIVGLVHSLEFCKMDEEAQAFSIPAPAKCLLVVKLLLYIGLASGEISVFNLDQMQEQVKFVCTDRPIHCLASAQEGFNKLLCVSAQDGAIIVVDTHSCLPLRILVGHSRTAFSIQVYGHTVYSASGDGTVLAQNLHTSTLEHLYNDNKGIVNSVCYYQGYLFTGGMDKLVRCYNAQTHELVLVFYGADRGVVTEIQVMDNKLVTGTLSGSVDVVDLDFEAQHRCHKTSCGLNFGNKRHLFWHIVDDHSISSTQ